MDSLGLLLLSSSSPLNNTAQGTANDDTESFNTMLIFVQTLNGVSCAIIVFSFLVCSFVLSTLCIRKFEEYRSDDPTAGSNNCNNNDHVSMGDKGDKGSGSHRYSRGRSGSISLQHQLQQQQQQQYITSDKRRSRTISGSVNRRSIGSETIALLGHTTSATPILGEIKSRITLGPQEWKSIWTSVSTTMINLLIVSDVIFCLFYFPTNVVRLILATKFKILGIPTPSDGLIPRILSGIIFCLSELAEMMVFSSGFFSLWITVCMYMVFRSVCKIKIPDTAGNALPWIASKRSSQPWLPNNLIKEEEEEEEEGADFGEPGASEDATLDPSLLHIPEVFTTPYRPRSRSNSAVSTESGINVITGYPARVSHADALRRHMEHVESRLTLAFSLVSFAVPLAICVAYVFIDLRYILFARNMKERLLADFVPDFFKTALYTIIEFLTLFSRLLIYLRSLQVLQDSRMSVNSRSLMAQRRKQEQRRMLRQLGWYSMAFLLFGIWISVYRTFADVSVIIGIVRRGWNEDVAHLPTVAMVMMAIHYVLSPLRACMNALVFTIVNHRSREWWRQKFNSIFSAFRRGKKDASVSPAFENHSSAFQH